MSNSTNYSLTFSNNNYVNNKKISNNIVKNRVISNLKKAEKLLTDDKFKKLQSDLIVNLKNSNIIVANIQNNKYKLDIIGGSEIPKQFPSQPPSSIVPLKNNSIQSNPSQITSEVPNKSNTITSIPQPTEFNTLTSKSINETSKPVTELNPTVSEPTVSEPVTELNPTVSEPTVSEPVTELHPTVSEPTVSEPVTELNPTVSEPVTELNPTVSESTVSESTVSEPVTELNPTVSESTVSESTVSEPVTELNPTESEPNSEYNGSTTEKKKTMINHVKGFFGFNGGYTSNSSSNNSSSSNSSSYDSSSYDSSSYDSDKEDKQTYFIDTNDSDEESILDKLNNQKYLKSLKVKELRDISRNNDLGLYKGGSYLKKNELIKQIHKKFKNT